MGLKVYTTQSVTALTGAEISLLEDAARACGRATLLVPSFAERDVCRRALADARVGTGVDVTTPEAWIEGLWELFGDGRRVVSPLERRMLVSALMDRRDAGQIAPLRDNPGTVRLISQIVEALLPEIAAPAVLGRNRSGWCFAWCALTPTCSPRAASSRLRRLRPSWRALSGMAPPRVRASSPCAMFPVCPVT